MNPATNLRQAVRFATRDIAPSTQRVPGVILTLYREAAGVPAVDVARVMDATKQYVAKLEKSTGVSIETAGKYRAAVDMLAGVRR